MNAPSMDPRTFLRELFDTAVSRARSTQAIAAHLPPPPRGRTVVVGAGKAAAAMAHAVDALWPTNAPMSGVVVTRYGHDAGLQPHASQRIEVLEASHPVPDEAGVRAAARLLQAVQGLTEDDLVIFLVSGGASSLLVAPVPGLTLEQKQQITRQLLACGAPIDEMNCVRKHLSRIKGGGLARACRPARLVTLAISDVPGDDPRMIGSGPTVPDTSTLSDAFEILHRHQIALTDGVRTALVANEEQARRVGDLGVNRGDFRLIATPRQCLEAAAQLALKHGIAPHILSDAVEGESREIAKMHAAIALSVADSSTPFQAPCVILSGGETTVTLSNRRHHSRGRGGRAGEFCLGLAQALQGHPRIWALAADTDGIDGVEENAGAFTTPFTLRKAKDLGLSARDHLDRNDAYSFFAGLGDLLVTGPTLTNVNDFRAVIVMP